MLTPQGMPGEVEPPASLGKTAHPTARGHPLAALHPHNPSGPRRPVSVPWAKRSLSYWRRLPALPVQHRPGAGSGYGLGSP